MELPHELGEFDQLYVAEAETLVDINIGGLDKLTRVAMSDLVEHTRDMEIALIPSSFVKEDNTVFDPEAVRVIGRATLVSMHKQLGGTPKHQLVGEHGFDLFWTCQRLGLRWFITESFDDKPVQADHVPLRASASTAIPPAFAQLLKSRGATIEQPTIPVVDRRNPGKLVYPTELPKRERAARWVTRTLRNAFFPPQNPNNPLRRSHWK